MGNMRVAVCLIWLPLAGCAWWNNLGPAPLASYSDYSAPSSADQSTVISVPPGSLAFTLEASAITLSPPAKTMSGCTSNDNWQTCLSGVSYTSSVIAPDDAVFDPTVYKTRFIATLSDNFYNDMTTSYVFVGTPVGDNPLLLKQITITSTNNLDAIVKGAATGAATGVLLGPIGAGAGAVLGAAVNIGAPPAYVGHLAGAKPIYFTAIDQVCSDLRATRQKAYDYSKLSTITNPTPVLELPVAIVPGPSDQFYQPATATTSTINPCWRPLPTITWANNSPPGGTLPPPMSGDGWFYRIVDTGDTNDADTYYPLKPKQNQTALKNSASIVENGHQFPISTCRKVDLQLIWWYALQNQGTPIEFDNIEIADPGYVNYMTIPRSGAINFGLTCGASTSISAAPSPWSTIFSDANAGATTTIKNEPSGSK